MSGGGSDVGKKAAQAQSQSARDVYEGSRPARDAFLKQVLAAMHGDASKVPVINSAMAGMQGATDTTLKDTADISNKLGFSQDTGRNISAPLAIRGASAGKDVRDQLLKQLTAQAPGIALQPAQIAQSGLAGAVQRSQANAAAKKASDQQTVAAGGAAAAAIAAAVIVAI